ncbi:MAG TPA: hypothetical protein VGQ71_15145 [Terriglobales bacterium]|nr:hypothetical protein [Terriglobales bacterium]
MKTLRSSITWFGAVTLLSWVSVASGQNFSLGWFTIDGGGGTSGGGVYSVSGTIGQPDAGAMSGGSYTLTGGFWVDPGPGLEVPPALRITRVDGNVRLTWPHPSTGFQLQQATGAVPPVGWADVDFTPVVVGEERQVTLPMSSAHWFFRLHKP